MIEALAKAIIEGKWAYADEILMLPASPLSLEGNGVGREGLDSLLPTGQTLLQLAVEARYPRFLRRLLDTGANPNVVNVDGDTPLIVSCRGDFAIETGVLLDHGADPNYKRPDGWTALRCAAKDRNYAAVRILLMKGAVVADLEPWSTALDDFARTVSEEFDQ